MKTLIKIFHFLARLIWTLKFLAWVWNPYRVRSKWLGATIPDIWGRRASAKTSREESARRKLKGEPAHKHFSIHGVRDLRLAKGDKT